MSKMKTEIFWSRYTDKQILYALQSHLYKEYGFKNDERPEIEDPFLRHVYFSCHPLEYLVDSGWANFQNSVWNTPEFFEALGYFYDHFLGEVNKKIVRFDPEEDTDGVRDFIVENQILLQFKTFEAVRLHRAKLEPILDRLAEFIEEFIKEVDAICIEQWKKDLE